MRDLGHTSSRALVTAALLALVPVTAVAGDTSAGWAGPAEFTGPALDLALADMNEFLQKTYARYDIMTELDAAPGADFRAVALATGEAPLAQPEPGERLAFGIPVSGGRTLDLQLAAFSAEVLGRGEDLFVRIARTESAKLPDFATVAADVYSGLSSDGRIRNDPTLDEEMLAMSAGLRAFDDRAARLGQAVPAISDQSFDRYIESLRLY